MILSSGIFFVLPCIETYQKVDLRTITLDVPPQEVLTRDSVTVSVGKISDNVSILLITPLHLVFQAKKNVRLNFSTFSDSKVAKD